MFLLRFYLILKYSLIFIYIFIMIQTHILYYVVLKLTS